MATVWKEPIEWANEGVAPSDNLKANGFKAGDKPPADVFNHFINRTGECISELQDHADTHDHDDRYYTETEMNTKLAEKSDTTHTHPNATTSAAGLMSASDKGKLDGVETGAEANQNAFSQVKVGSTTINAGSETDAVTLAAGDNVTLTPDSTNKKVTISAKDTVYTHPSTSGNKHIPSGGSSGKILRWSADGTAEWGDDKDTTYGAASQSASGLMSAADKKKLDGVDDGANAYTHPSYTARTGVPTANATPAFGGTFNVSQPVSDASGHITEINNRTVTIPNTPASTSAAGLMSATDKSKLDDVENNATLSVPVVSAASSDGVAYTATVDGVTTLKNGLVVVISPSMTATSTTPTLNINSLGAKQIRRKLSGGTLTRPALLYANVVYKDVPVELMYDGTYWVATQFTKPSATDLYGQVPVQGGGWFVNSNTTDEDKAEALENLKEIGVAPAYTYGTTDITAGSASTEAEGTLHFVYE